MAKKDFKENQDMTLEESKAFRAALYKPDDRKLPEHEKREKFRLFWAENRKDYGKEKSLEEVLWIHLKATKLDDPKRFEEGLKHFGLKKVR